MHNKGIKVAIVCLIGGLVLGILVSWGGIFYQEFKAKENQISWVQAFSKERLYDTYHKIGTLLGERNLERKTGQIQTRGVVALIQGSLGIHNVGYAIREGQEKSVNGLLWKNYWVQKEGDKMRKNGVVVCVPYVSLPAQAEQNAQDLSIVLEAARVFAGKNTSRPLSFLFTFGTDIEDGEPDLFKDAKIILWIKSSSEFTPVPKNEIEWKHYLEKKQPDEKGGAIALSLGWDLETQQQGTDFLGLEHRGEEFIESLEALLRMLDQ